METLTDILKDGFKVKTENELTVENDTIIKVVLGFALLVGTFFLIKTIAK